MKTSPAHVPLRRWIITAALALLPILSHQSAIADGTETLGPASLTVTQGSAVVGATVQLGNGQPGFINVTVPAGTTIKQVLLYWDGVGFPGRPVFGDNTAILNDTLEVIGTLIGGNEDSGGEAPLDGTFRADITALNLVAPGANTIKIGGLDFEVVYGASLLVIYSDGSQSLVQVADGNDWAFFFDNGSYGVTAPQTFNFPAASSVRMAKLVLSFGSISTPDFPVRPNSIEIVVGNVTNRLTNLIGAGGDFSSSLLNIDVEIPAAVTSVTVRPFSRDDNATPASIPAGFNWSVAALSTPLPAAPPAGQCVRGHGFWKNHPKAWCSDSIVVGGRTYSKAAAIAILKTPPAGGDKTYNLFHQLVAAKLNVCVGCDDSCVADAIRSADWFLSIYPPGSRVKANTSAWKSISQAFSTLGSYNEGALCVRSAEGCSETCNGSCEKAPPSSVQLPTSGIIRSNVLSTVPQRAITNLQTQTPFLIKKPSPVVLTPAAQRKAAAPVTKPQISTKRN